MPGDEEQTIDDLRLAFLRAARDIAGEIERHPRWPLLAADPWAAGAVRAAHDAVEADADLQVLAAAFWDLAAVVELLSAPSN